jgi:RNA polymerase sigma-70 factor, ECF subfamily
MYTTAQSLLVQMRQPCNPGAWRRFVDLYSPLLYRWMRGVGLPPDDTADLTQDVFLSVFAHLPAFERRRAGSFRTWLRTIVVNKVRTFQRRKKPVPLGPDATPAVRSDLAAAWEAEYATAVLGRALELVEPEFEPQTWLAFRRLQLEGQPAARVADELGMTRNAVYIARCRVLRRLRDEVEHLLD